jgi:hypothetical protein
VLCARTRLHEESQPLASSQAGTGVACCSRRASAERPPFDGALEPTVSPLGDGRRAGSSENHRGPAAVITGHANTGQVGESNERKIYTAQNAPVVRCVCVCASARMCAREMCCLLVLNSVTSTPQ